VVSIKNGCIYFKGGAINAALTLKQFPLEGEFIQHYKSIGIYDEKELKEVYKQALKLIGNDDICAKSPANKSRKHSGTNKTGISKAN